MLRESVGMALGVVFRICCLAVLCPLARADGVFLSPPGVGDTASSAAQKAILIQEGADEVLLLRTTYAGPTSEFAWIVPVPVIPTEVFEAEEAFLDEVFRHTDPRVVVHIADMWAQQPRSRYGDMRGVAAGEDNALGGPARTVAVHERREMGDYDVAVLSATGEGALLEWLKTNGFAVGDAVRGAFEPYIASECSFVAVRFLTAAADAAPVVQEVTPIGIRFAVGERLWFPLTISRASAPALTSVLLCVIADGPMTCETLPCVRLPEEKRTLPQGRSYGSVREEMTRGADGPALLCEYCGARPLWFQDLSYRADAWGDSSLDTGIPEKTATRFYGLLAPEEMEDLWFAPDAPEAGDYQVVIECSGTPNYDESSAVAPERLQPRGGTGAAIPVRPIVTDAGRQSAPRAPWALLGAVGLGAGVGGALVWTRRRKARVLLPLLALPLACLLARDAGAGLVDEGRASVLRVVEAAIQDFERDCGCYPAKLEDLTTSAAPSEGLDVSGNATPLSGEWRGPYLTELPSDPFGVGLLYDVRGMGLVDYAGMEMKVSGEALEDPIEAAPIGAGWASVTPSGINYWIDYPFEHQAVDSGKVAEWLATRDPDGLAAMTPLQGRPVSGWPSYKIGGTLVADAGSLEYVSCGAYITVDPESGCCLTARTIAQPSEGEPMSGVFRVALGEGPVRYGRRPVPAPAGYLEAAPGGGAVALVSPSRESLMQSIWIVRENDAPRFLAELTVLRLAWSPDGDAVYVLGWLGADAERSAALTRVPSKYDRPSEEPGKPTCDLFRIRLADPVPTVLAAGASPDVLAVGELGALVTEGGEARLYGREGMEPKRIALKDGMELVAARFTPEGLLYAAVVGEGVGAVGSGPWYGEMRLAKELPSADDRLVATLRWTPGSQLALLGCVNDGVVVCLRELEDGHKEKSLMKWVGFDGSGATLQLVPTAQSTMGFHDKGPEPLAALPGASVP